MPDDSSDPTRVVTTAWQAVEGDVLLPVDYADWLGAGLSVLIAAIHHPQVLAEQQPDTDARDVATDVLDELPELDLAARTAEGQRPSAGGPPPRDVRVALHRNGRHVRISPGSELQNLVLNLEIFANAVLHPEGDHARTARGAIAYSASAWSRQLGEATGALPSATASRAGGRSHDHLAVEAGPAASHPSP